MGDLRNESVRFRMNFSFVCHYQHLLKTKLPGGRQRGVLRDTLIRFYETCCAKEQCGRKSHRATLFEHLQVGHIRAYATYCHLTMEGTKDRISFVTEPTKADRTL